MLSFLVIFSTPLTSELTIIKSDCFVIALMDVAAMVLNVCALASVTIDYLMVLKWLKIIVHSIGKQWRFMYKTKSFEIMTKQINKYWYWYHSLLWSGDIMDDVIAVSL